MSDRLRICDHVHYREFDGELVVLDLATGSYFGLNGTATVLWQALARGSTIAEAADEIVTTHDVVRETVLSDLEGLVAEWRERGLVEPK